MKQLQISAAPLKTTLHIVLLAVLVTTTVLVNMWWLIPLVVSALLVISASPLVVRVFTHSDLAFGRLQIAWILILVATLSIDSASRGGLGNAQLVRLLLLSMALMLALPNITNWVKQRKYGLWFGTLGNWFLVYLGFALLSSFWSTNKLVTLGKVFEISVALIVIFAIAAQPNSNQHLKNLFYFTLGFISLLLGIILVGYIVSPDQFTTHIRLANLYTLSGGFIPLPKNSIARLGADVAIVAFAYVLNRNQTMSERTLAAGLVVFGASFPFLAQGRTGIAALIICILFLIFLNVPIATILLIPLAFLAYSYYYANFTEFFMRGQSLDQLSGLSGRVDWWSAGLEALRQQPLVGYGFGVGGRTALAEISGVPAGIHNGFLEVALGIGLLGFTIWLLVFVWWFIETIQKLLNKQDIQIYCLGVPILLATVLSQGAGGWMSIELGLFLIMMVLMDLQRQQKSL